MEQLRSEFETAASGRGDDLLGTWVLVRHVMTEAFITGRTGPDHLLSDPDGVRRDMWEGQRRLEWLLTIVRGTDHKLRAISQTVWEPSGDSSVLEFTEHGNFVFEKQYGGDGRWIYRCRRKDSRELVCLLKDHETGHGVVFRKTEPPPNKALEPAAFNILLRTETLSRGGSAPAVRRPCEYAQSPIHPPDLAHCAARDRTSSPYDHGLARRRSVLGHSGSSTTRSREHRAALHC